MQSLVSQTADTSHYDFETADWYDEDVIEGRKIVVEAMYLITFCLFSFPPGTNLKILQKNGAFLITNWEKPNCPIIILLLL